KYTSILCTYGLKYIILHSFMCREPCLIKVLFWKSLTISVTVIFPPINISDKRLSVGEQQYRFA
ncbi:MAG: hypothetical protein RR557_09190, partial [Bacilli bacterium]